MKVRLTSLADALRSIEEFQAQGATLQGPWAWSQMLEHCAQSIECSLDGFPKKKAAIVQKTIGRWAARRFLKRGFLRHKRTATIPGLEVPPARNDDEAFQRLKSATKRFVEHDGPLAPHFVFGDLSKADFEKLHAMHIADHLEGCRAASS